jgi:glutathione peroxidase
MFLGVLFMSKAHASSAYDYSFQTIDGTEMPLSEHQGKTVLIVNTASFCGFTKQYGSLQKLWETYKDKGFVVIGVPSNDFGAQEPGSESEIQEFCQVNYGVDFPLTEKATVKGDAAHPFYKWARKELGFVAAPKWNFHKYLIGPDGKLVDWFSSTTDPMAKRVTAKIEKLLMN